MMEQTLSDWMGNCSLPGQIGAILCWYFDGEKDAVPIEDTAYAVSLIPKLLSGQTEQFSTDDWWYFYDALGSYPERCEELEEIYQMTGEGFHERLPTAPTKRYWPEDFDVTEN